MISLENRMSHSKSFRYVWLKITKGLRMNKKNAPAVSRSWNDFKFSREFKQKSPLYKYGEATFV